ncbi:GDSL-type esterase/lipase family protein [Streptomyces sp. NBC_00322]|uniref:GDSL-type esterase/lipase family protein n=1 Tax=Streptomyces sp. NBC_00322 TaxID=2975712 RepID=UPI002E28C1B1|nr:GDSL-type esterase/lipase family protein [Streptomyces sp. NBC_00322]
MRRAAIVSGQAIGVSALLGSLAGTANAAPGDPGHVRITVIGDSYTSGEGASAGTYKTVQVTGAEGSVLNQIDPAHQSATAPTLRAIDKIAQENPNVTFDVTFVPVSGATRGSLYETVRPGTEFEHSPQIDAVNDANIVIVGVGGNDAGFGNLARTVVTSRESTTEQEFPNMMGPLQDGTYLSQQAAVYQDIASRAAPGATIVTLGYPKVMPDAIPGGSPSPVSEMLISNREAQLVNEFGSTINSLNQQATQLAAQQSGANVTYADVSQALSGHELFSPQEGLNGLDFLNVQGSYHPNDLGQALIANTLTPTVNQAVIHELGNQGLVGPPAPEPDPLPPVDPAPENPPAPLDPGAPDPGTPDPGVPDPGTPDPGLPDPGTPDPGVPDPGTPDPGVPDPGTPDPGLPDPGTPDPGLPDPITDPGVTDPGVTDPVVPDPVVPDPVVPDPVVTEPITDPGMPDPGFTDPVMPDPIVPEPIADPGFTDPVMPEPITDPGFTDPGFTDPGFTDPVMPDPVVLEPIADPGFADPGFSDPGSFDSGFSDSGSFDSGFSDSGSFDSGF